MNLRTKVKALAVSTGLLICNLALADTPDGRGSTNLYADQPNSGANSLTESTRMGPWGFDLSGQDLKVKPGEDFYTWANGEWHKRTVIPADRSGYSSFSLLVDLSLQRARSILEDAAKSKSTDRKERKLGDAWTSFMDETRIEQLDSKPLAAELNEIARAKTGEDLTRLMGRSNYSGFRSVFSISIYEDAKSPERYAIYLSPGGLGLPDRDYYFESRFIKEKSAYTRYVQQLLDLVQWPDSEKEALAIVDMETQIAQASWTRAQMRDREKTYHPMSLTELQSLAPRFEWNAFFEEAKLGVPSRIVVRADTAIAKVAKIFSETDLSTLKAWEAFNLVDSSASVLSKRFTQARFEFRSKTLNGQPEERPRWKRGIEFVNSILGEAVGERYVGRYFPEQSKQKMIQLVDNIRQSMKQRIQTRDWMSAPTKAEALTKLEKLGVKIGYPEVWRDYSALDIQPDDVYGNRSRSQVLDWQRLVNRINLPVDKQEWGMTPQTVNAYYRYPKNEIVFPAAILQPPFFDPLADDAVNYGGIGGVIGHEISHGFDDQGRKSDGDGVLRDWWTAEDAAKFSSEASKLGQQFSSYEPFPGMKINGALTMGENIGDLGGLTIAFNAYRLSLGGAKAPVLDGTTGDQRVFLGWAQIYRGKFREEAERQDLVSDPHSPWYYRVNGIVRNMDAWYEAFGVGPQDSLYLAPKDRIRIW